MQKRLRFRKNSESSSGRYYFLKKFKKGTKNDSDFKKSLYYEGPEQRSSDRTIEEIERDLKEEKRRMLKMRWPAVYEGI